MHENKKKKKENEIKEEKKDGVLFRMLVARTYIFFFPPFFPLEMRLFFPTAMMNSRYVVPVYESQGLPLSVPLPSPPFPQSSPRA